MLDALAETGDLTGRVVKLAVTDMPGSGTPEELRAWAGSTRTRSWVPCETRSGATDARP